MTGERPIFAEDESGRLVPMAPAAPPSEDELQALIAEHPDIVGEAEGELLFLAREQPVADSEGGSGRWSLDHLFVTRGAVPVLLEVKRATDTRLRREVVGQLLDYAANGTAYWPSGTLEGAFRATCAARDCDADDVLVEFLGEGDPAAFWPQVEANLAAGRLRLVIAADLIPSELARIIEFLNDQMRAEVRGVELRYYRSAGGRRTLVPRIIGLTERARAVKGDPQSGNRFESLEQMLGVLRAERDPSVVAAAEQLVSLFREQGAEFSVLANNRINVAIPSTGGAMVKPIRLGGWGRLEFKLSVLSVLPTFRSAESRQAWLNRVAAEVGGLTHTKADRYPRLSLEGLTGDRLATLENLLRELIRQIKLG